MNSDCERRGGHAIYRKMKQRYSSYTELSSNLKQSKPYVPQIMAVSDIEDVFDQSENAEFLERDRIYDHFVKSHRKAGYRLALLEHEETESKTLQDAFDSGYKALTAFSMQLTYCKSTLALLCDMDIGMSESGLTELRKCLHALDASHKKIHQIISNPEENAKELKEGVDIDDVHQWFEQKMLDMIDLEDFISTTNTLLESLKCPVRLCSEACNKVRH